MARRYSYYVGYATDLDGSGRKTYPVMCQSWDDFEDTGDSWVRVVNWYDSRAVAQIEAEAFQANADEARAKLARENEAAGFTSATAYNRE
jgi:hypothetical protein